MGLNLYINNTECFISSNGNIAFSVQCEFFCYEIFWQSWKPYKSDKLVFVLKNRK